MSADRGFVLHLWLTADIGTIAIIAAAVVGVSLVVTLFRRKS